MTLHSRPPVWIEDLQVFPDVASTSVRVRGRIGNASGQAGAGRVALRVSAGPDTSGSRSAVDVEASWTPAGGTFEARVPLWPGAPTWDEFTPALLVMTAVMPNGAARRELFGLREVSTSGTQFTVNGRRTFLRGTLECAIFPKTGHPPTDLESWTRIVRIAKAHGLNHLRFHSWCPPEAAFEAADRLGFYYYVEAGSWANQSTRIGDRPARGRLGQPRNRPDSPRLRQPPVVRADVLRQRAGRPARGVPRRVGDAQSRARSAPAVHERRPGGHRLAENQFHVTPDPARAGLGRGPRLPDQCEAAGDAH